MIPIDRGKNSRTPVFHLSAGLEDKEAFEVKEINVPTSVPIAFRYIVAIVSVRDEIVWLSEIEGSFKRLVVCYPIAMRNFFVKYSRPVTRAPFSLTIRNLPILKTYLR